MRTYVGPLPLAGLGSVGRLDLLETLDGPLLVPLTVREAVTTEPAATNLRRFGERGGVRTDIPGNGDLDGPARAVLGEAETTPDVRLVAGVLEHAGSAGGVGVVADDRRTRTVARGLGATVSGTVGVLVRAVEAGRSLEAVRGVLHDLDGQGLHATGRYLETAESLLAEAAGPSAGRGVGRPGGGRAARD